MKDNIKAKKHLTSFQVIILSFASVILIGTVLLMLPVSSRQGVVTPFNEALFTSTSAVCVTGLVVQDTASYWSDFGQVVILLLIQVGGMGVITVALSLALASGKKISLMQRSIMQEAISAPKVGGVMHFVGFVIKISLVTELIGALIMMPYFSSEYGMRGIWMSFFHSVSAFCNAGFDLMGTDSQKFVSLMGFADNPIINITVIMLIIVGGIGFLTWQDVATYGYHIKKYRMQSKVILFTTAILILLPFVYFYLFEYNDLSVNKRVLASLFQAVTPRTAGFNTVDLTELSGAGLCIMIILMLIGGSPGSTAGGMKTTTIAVLVSNAVSVFRRGGEVHFFGRSVEEDVIKNASTILIMYIFTFIGGGIVISMVEGLPIGICLFETASAIGTVGLTLGITSQLGIISQCVLIVLMFLGRVGGLTLIYAAISGVKNTKSRLPHEKLTVG